jgi:hypothetical protein
MAKNTLEPRGTISKKVVSQLSGRSPIIEDIGSPRALNHFKKLAASFTLSATKSREVAIKTLKREGMLTAKGNLTQRYTTK